MAATDALRLARIDAATPVPRGPVNLQTGVPPLWIDLTLTVENRSEDTDWYVMTTIRRLRYEETEATLHIELNEPGGEFADHGQFAWQFVVPDFVLVAAGSSTSLHISVPAVLNLITAPAPSETGVSVKSLDISDLQHVHCTLAYSDQPFAAEPGAAPEDMLRQLASWGRSIEVALEVIRDTSTSPGAD